jgi:Zn finger protein HypA/HybF involved in hydrogenase expression
MAAKVPAAQNRLFKNVFICKVCKQKMRLEPLKVMAGKVKCRKCNSKAFRVIRKK